MKEWIKRALRKYAFTSRQKILRDQAGIVAFGEGCGEEGECDGYDVTTVYIGTDKSPDQGQLNRRDCLESNCSCCGYGCSFSLDDIDAWANYGAYTGGKRFLPYYEWTRTCNPLTGLCTHRQRRNAKGLLSDLKTNVPQLVPPDIYYMRYPVFRNETGEECPVASSCDYSDQNASPTGTVPCEHGEGLGESILAYYGDQMFHNGSNVPPRGGGHCRFLSDTDQIIPVHPANQPLDNTCFLRSGFNVPLHFITNMLVPLTAEVQEDNSSCQSSLGNDEEPVPHPDYYLINSGIRNRFDKMQVQSVSPIGLVDTTLPINKIRNAVLNHVSTIRMPDPTVGNPQNLFDLFQVDRLEFPSFAAPMLYRRDYNFDNRVPTASLAIVQGVDLKARLHFKRTPIHVQLVIKRAMLEVSIICHKILRHGFSTPFNPTMQPHCKAKYYVTLGVRVTSNSMPPITVQYPWIPPDSSAAREVTLTLPVNNVYNDPLPKIVPSNDYIEYFVVENGKEFPVQIPTEVEWHGALNSYSIPKVPTITLANHTSSLEGMAFTLLDKVRLTGGTPVIIRPVPTSLDANPEDPNTIYRGAIRVGFMPSS
jgi:hypothetical protein